MAGLEIINRPDWMDDTFIKQCIVSANDLKNGDNIHVDQVILSYVVPFGENYMSVMTRASVNYSVNTEGGNKNQTKHEHTFVVKMASEQIKLVSEKLVQNEIDIYVNVVPKLKEILSNTDIRPTFLCRYIHHVEPPTRVLVLEDLKPLGYVMLDRKQGLDFDHCKLVYKSLAEFHASSMCYYYNKEHELKDQYKKVAFDDMTLIGGTTTQQYIDTLTNKIPKFKNLFPKEERYQKIVRFLDKFEEIAKRGEFLIGRNQKGNKFNAMNHGDFWTNNIMFHYDKNRNPENAIFVDLQACTYQSIAYDFNFFFVSSPSLDVMRNSYEELRNVYYESLIQTLKTLNYKGEYPTLDEFKQELRENVAVVMLIIMFMSPMILADKKSHTKTREEGEAYNFDEMHEIQTKAVSPLYYDKMTVAFDVLLEQGYFDDYNTILPIH